MQSIKIAVAQFCGGQSVSSNLSTCTRLMRLASQQGAKIVFLPEASDFIGNPPEEALLLAQSLEVEDVSLSTPTATTTTMTTTSKSSFLKGLCDEAKQLGIGCSVGIHEKSPLQGRLYNTHVLISPQGDITSSYRKIHLFDVNIAPNGPRLMESNTTVPGGTVTPPVSTPVGKVGLGICYDVRFPEMALKLRRMGAEILTYPSAFTVKTGEAHWEVLLRSRAIETQCYVVAAAQVGQHSEKRASYGHAMIVDPWGRVVAKCDGQEENIAVAEIDLEAMERIRTEMPVLNHRRDDVFSQ